MIKDNRNNEQIYGRNDMVMLNPNNKIYGSLGIADKYVMKTEEGKSLTLNNPKLGSFDDVLTEFDMYGWSEQKKYNGYQLLPLAPINKVTGEKLNLPYTESGITVDIANDGIGYTVRGTNTLDGQKADIYLSIANEFDIEAGTYTRSGKIINGNSDVGIVSGGALQNGGVLEYKDYKSDFTFTETVEKGKSGNFIIRISQNATVNATVYFQIEKGSVAHDYEPYTGGIPSPSPEYPQEIKSVGDSGSVVVKVSGANVLEGTKLGVKSTVNGITYTTYENGILITGTATKDFHIVLHNDIIHPLTRGDYYLTTSGLNSSVFLNFYYVGKFVDDRQNIKVTLDKDVEYSLKLQIPKGEMLNTTVQVSLTKSKITSYEPYYEEQTATLPYILNAIPVSSGGNVTIDGQQYIADYVDVEREKLVRNIENVIFNGAENENWILWNNEDDKGWSFMFLNAVKTFRNESSSKCNRFEFNEDEKCDRTFWLCNPSGNPSLQIKNRIIGKDITAFKSWLSNNPIDVIYPLRIPIEEELTTEQAQALKEFVTHYPVTIIENNYNTWMKATYKSIESV